MSTAKSLHDLILAADDIPKEIHEVPQWGVKVEIRGMSGNERAEFTQNFADNEGHIDYKALYPDMVIRAVFDPDTGERVFTDTDEERQAILTKSGASLEFISTTAMRLSGLGADSKDEAGKPSS